VRCQHTIVAVVSLTFLFEKDHPYQHPTFSFSLPAAIKGESNTHAQAKNSSKRTQKKKEI
jgi:hypothetical protein